MGDAGLVPFAKLPRTRLTGHELHQPCSNSGSTRMIKQIGQPNSKTMFVKGWLKFEFEIIVCHYESC